MNDNTINDTKKNKKIGRKTTIIARIIRLTSIAVGLAVLVTTGINQLILFAQIRQTALDDVMLLTASYSSAIANADIYSNPGFMDHLFTDLQEKGRYNGIGFVFTKLGLVVCDTHSDIVTNGTNVVELGETDPGYAELGEFMKEVDPPTTTFDKALEMISLKDDQRLITINGTKYFAGWATTEHYDTLYVMVLLPYNEVLKGFITAMLVVPVVGLLSIALATVCAILIAAKITEPMSMASKRMGELARGDLTSPTPRTSRNDETLYLLKSLSLVTKSMRAYIEDIQRVLSAVADGDLTVRPQAEYKGDFESLKVSLDKILSSLSATFSEVQRAALSVNTCSISVSDGTASLSRNSTEAADASDELAHSLEAVSEQIRINASEADNARLMTTAADSYSTRSAENMRQMMAAINDIEQTSAQIETIIDVIDDIAFQTNILALNAAVEAARAGDAGKGFAVVADEVRSLALRSAEAATQTRSLIVNSLRSVENGARLAKETEQDLADVAKMIGKATSIVEHIARNAGEQAEAVADINKGMSTINSRISENSDTAEQNAAVSEELSGQFENLNEMLNRFRFNDSKNGK
ncbi:MAG: methyl-accepting chemotaxis protein [Oscillospiraceae bacterium]|nr:methyl-accepting chemotaxis protein [Oscillospiraceae bacterium]